MIKLNIFKLEWDNVLGSYQESHKMHSEMTSVVPRIGEAVFFGTDEYVVESVAHHFDLQECIRVVELFVKVGK